LHPEKQGFMKFRHKALAALLSFLFGAIGLHGLYLGLRFWWWPLTVTAPGLLWMFRTAFWYQSPAFFLVMIPVSAGFIHALVLALMPDTRFDARFNAGTTRTNHTGWDAVLVAIATLTAGSIVLITVLALFFQTFFEGSVH